VRLLCRRWDVRSIDIALVMKLVLVWRIMIWIGRLVGVRSHVHLLRRWIEAWVRRVCIYIVVAWPIHVNVVVRGCRGRVLQGIVVGFSLTSY
jgi:hypothetical protein